MGVLYALESIRTPVLDKIMLIISELGGEAPFLIIAIAVFWCIDKRKGYYLMTVGFFGMILNQFLKILCCVPRPWVKDPDFTIVEPARAGATGYSFPSGHTQNAVALYGGIARCTGSVVLRVVCIVLAVLIAFSRMYLGVHTPLDVGVSLVIATVLVLALYPLMEEVKRRPAVQTYVIAGMVVCSGAFLAYLYLRGDTGATAEDTANYVNAVENGWKFVGVSLALLAANIIAGKPEQKESLRAPVENQLLMLRTRTEETDEIRKVKKQRIGVWCGAAILCLICGGMAGRFLLDWSNFASRDLEVVVRQMAIDTFPWIGLAFILLMAAEQWNFRLLMKELELRRSAPKRKPDAAALEKTTGRNVIRVVIAAAAVALIVLGVMNGGMFDVLVKAINICTECIGLG